jgi:hypothetical protein
LLCERFARELLWTAMPARIALEIAMIASLYRRAFLLSNETICCISTIELK